MIINYQCKSFHCSTPFLRFIQSLQLLVYYYLGFLLLLLILHILPSSTAKRVMHNFFQTHTRLYLNILFLQSVFNVCITMHRRFPPALGDEGSKTPELSLHALEACSASFFFALASEGLCDFLFLMRIFPISSCGLGKGTPDSSWEQQTEKLISESLNLHK